MTERDPRDRPPGLAPRGSSAALGIVILYWVMVPALFLLALIPFGRTVFTFLFPVMACPVLSALVLMPLAIGFPTRRYWAIILFYWAAKIVIMALFAAVVTLAVVLIFTYHAPPPMIAVTWMVAPLLLLLTALVVFPLRVLRLAYWRPGTTPAEWETGDERVNPRVARALGGKR